MECVCRIALAFVLLLTITHGPAAASDSTDARNADISILIDKTTVNGGQWGGVSGGVIIGKLMPNLPSFAPSAVLCVVATSGATKCFGRKVRDQTLSECSESFDCDWRNVEVPRGLFAIVFYSHGIVLGNTFIDSVIVSDRPMHEDDPARTRMDAVVHSVVDRLAPTANPFEGMRRQRPFQVLRAGSCREPCRLRQSTVTFQFEDE